MTDLFGGLAVVEAAGVELLDDAEHAVVLD
jgi:hypothetical protein